MNSILKKQQIYGAQNAIVDYIFCKLFPFLVKCYFVSIHYYNILYKMYYIYLHTCIILCHSLFVLYHSLQGISIYVLLICYFNRKILDNPTLIFSWGDHCLPLHW